MEKPRHPLVSLVLPSVVLLLFSNILLVSFAHREHTLYAWDHVAYWSMSLDLARDFRERPIAALSEIGRSVWEDEINLLPTTLPALVLIPTSGSRAAYLLAIFNLYSIPTLIFGFILFTHICGNRRAPNLAIWCSAIFLLPSFWQPLTLGYPGSGGMILAFLVLTLAWTRDDNHQDVSLSKLLLMALLLALLTLFRRWWAFWTLSFCLVWAGELLLRAGFQFSSDPVQAKKHLKRLAVLGSSVLAFLLLLGGPRILTIARTDYAGEFSHYKIHDGLQGVFVLLKGEFGLLGLLLLFAAWLLLLFEPRWASRVIFLSAHSLLTAILFLRVQDPSPQHWYLLMPAALLLLAGGIQTAIEKFPSPQMRIVFVAIGLGGILISGSVFGLRLPGVRLAPRIRIKPTHRTDLQEIRNLMAFLDEREATRTGWIYVLSGTGKLPESGLAFINLSLGSNYRCPAWILETQQVDLRDGFPRGIFLARYLLAPRPAQYRGTTQRVIQLPAEDFQNGTGVASAFSAIGKKFYLEGGIEVQVFERVRPNSRDEIDGLSHRLRSYYPDHPKVWRYLP